MNYQPGREEAFGGYRTNTPSFRRVPLQCQDAASCYVSSKSEVTQAFNTGSSERLQEKSQAFANKNATVLVVLLNAAGVAVFRPGIRAKRILPQADFNYALPNYPDNIFVDQFADRLSITSRRISSLYDCVRHTLEMSCLD